MEFQETSKNHVCIVGAGPAGVMLAYLFAKQGIPVTLLEGQADFDRDFRGDTLHASSLEILDQLGLAESIIKLAHGKLVKLQFSSKGKPVTVADFSELETKYPYVALVPQEQFLTFMVNEARKFPDFNLLMNARVTELIVDDKQIKGVIYNQNGKETKLYACLTVGADGRGSTVRQKAGIKLEKTAPPMDVIWFKLPRFDNDLPGMPAGIRFGTGTMVVMLNRGAEWQMGYVILKGSYKQLRSAGIPAFHSHLLGLVPELERSLQSLKDWNQCAILSVVTGRVNEWSRPGLLLIGDAAHVMSPVGGVGINYALQDAVTAANLLIEVLLNGQPDKTQLSNVQKQREFSVKFIQTIQALIQKNIIANALKSDKPFEPPAVLCFLAKFSLFRKTFARTMAYGISHCSLNMTR